MGMRKDNLLKVIGSVFLAWGVIAVANSIFGRNPSQIFWICYSSLLILGIGVLRKEPALIGSMINVQAIPLLIWTADFLYLVFTGNSLLGITNYFFLEGRETLSQIISLQHLFTIPLALYSLYLIKPGKKDFWKISFVFVLATFFIVRVFTSPEQNINCAFESCIGFDFGINYAAEWLLSYTAMILLVNFILVKIPGLFWR